MKVRWFLVTLLLLSPSVLCAQDKKKKTDAPFDAKPALVPFRLSDTHHTIVRVKINGKGPFNFVVDTGCPVLLIAEPVGQKIGLKTEKYWATLDKLELEGGLELTKVKARVETPFQIEGMNGMGLAGVELHGLMGYTVLAKFKMDYDYTKNQMIWTPLKAEPLAPMPLGGGKGGGGSAGMEVMIGLVRLMTAFLGVGPAPPPQPRGFFGFELDEKEKQVRVARVLADSPAAKAGLKKGDRILTVESDEVTAIKEVLQRASKITAGKTLNIIVEREKEKHELKITAGDGL